MLLWRRLLARVAAHALWRLPWMVKRVGRWDGACRSGPGRPKIRPHQVVRVAACLTDTLLLCREWCKGDLRRGEAGIDEVLLWRGYVLGLGG